MGPWWAHYPYPEPSSSPSDLVLLSLKGKWSLQSVLMTSFGSKQPLWLSCFSCRYVPFCPLSCCCALGRQDWASFLPPVSRPEGNCLWPVLKLVTYGPDQQGHGPPNLATYVWGAICATFITNACQLWALKPSSMEPSADMSWWFIGTWWFSCVLRWLNLSPIFHLHDDRHWPIREVHVIIHFEETIFQTEKAWYTVVFTAQ